MELTIIPWAVIFMLVGTFGDTPEGFRPFTRSKTTAKTTYTISRDKVSPPKKTSKKMKRKENHIRCFNHKNIRSQTRLTSHVPIKRSDRGFV